jgi:hypothetical protein
MNSIFCIFTVAKKAIVTKEVILKLVKRGKEREKKNLFRFDLKFCEKGPLCSISPIQCNTVAFVILINLQIRKNYSAFN